MKKIRIGLLALTALTGIAAVCAASIDANEPFANEVSIAQSLRREKLAAREEGAHLADNAIYLKMSESSSWYSDSAKFAIYFFNSQTDGWSGFLTKKYKDSYGAAVFEGTVPTPSKGDAWTTMIAVRFNPVGSTGDSWNGKWNQTENISIHSGEVYRNEIEVSSGDSSSGVYKVGAGERLKYFAWAFGWSAPEGDGKNICTNSNDSAYLSALSNSWETSQTDPAGYNYLGADVKAYFSNVVANDSASTVDGFGAGLAARYDHIVAAHGLANFASR
jgi:hypothetical protein